jgi:drug/metabolite transporter (DMT)-like permease
MFSEIGLFFFIIVVGTVGELCMARAMKTIGEPRAFSPRALVAVVARAFRLGWMWLGFAMTTLAYFALLGLLARANVSFVIPVTALSYLVGAVGSRRFLDEEITHRRWMGVLVVCVGVMLVCFAER